jgi:hypothetical protein
MGGIVDKIKEVCFSVNAEDRQGLHKDVIDNLKNVLINEGYNVHLEYPIHFKSRIRKSGDKVIRDGNLDLVAFKDRDKIAIEFDNSVFLKFKSIEKLLQVAANVCIGVVRGKANTLEGSIKRIEQVKEEYVFLEKNFWLIILKERSAYKVETPLFSPP